MNGLFDPWCNGNTADSGSAFLGSNPGGSTERKLFSGLPFFVPGWNQDFSRVRKRPQGSL